MKKRVRWFLALFLLFVGALVSAESYTVYPDKRSDRDSVVVLVKADSAKLVERDGQTFRQVIGGATFFHNNTYLKCDSALWNVNENVIRAMGHVEVIQEDTYLTGDQIDYIVDVNLARVTGRLVELYDRQGNILRTTEIDYNTKDSTGFFGEGGALKNSDGNIIESTIGYYYGNEKKFSFCNNVQVFIDSTFIVSDEIDYYTESKLVEFGRFTTGWKEENMLFANKGTYDRNSDLFTLTKDGYLFSKDQEVWGDIIEYNKTTGRAEIRNNAQIVDTAQHVIFLGDLAIYEKEPRIRALLTDNPAMLMISKDKDRTDTLYMRADVFELYQQTMAEVDSTEIARAQTRSSLLAVDPLKDIDRTAALNNPDKNVRIKQQLLDAYLDSISKPAVDSILARRLRDTTIASMLLDSIARADFLKDSLAKAAKDTMVVNFVKAYHNIKLFRNDVQAVADSLIYTGLDSIARFYKQPVLWSGEKNQISSDSMQVQIVDNALKKADFMSEAFIAAQEDSIYFNQIKSMEMVAYFNNNDIYRFDALGGVSSIFYIQEDSVYTSINMETSKLMTAKFKNREIQHIRSITEVKSDVHPLFNMPVSEQRLRGFIWLDSLRPKSRHEITTRIIKESERERLQSTPFPYYSNTKKYFPALRDSIFAYKNRVDSLIAAKNRKDVGYGDPSVAGNTIAPDTLHSGVFNPQVPDIGRDTTFNNERDTVITIGRSDVKPEKRATALPTIDELVDKKYPVLSEQEQEKMPAKEVRSYNKKRRKYHKLLLKEQRKKEKFLAREQKRRKRL